NYGFSPEAATQASAAGVGVASGAAIATISSSKSTAQNGSMPRHTGATSPSGGLIQTNQLPLATTSATSTTTTFFEWLQASSSGALPPVSGIRNGDFFFKDPAHPAFGWDVRGAVGVDGGHAVLTEDSSRQTSMWQFFYLPAWATGLEFVIEGLNLEASEGSP